MNKALSFFRYTALVLCISAATTVPRVYAKESQSTIEKEQLEKRARDHFEKGKNFYGQKRYDEALIEFEIAYRIVPSPELQMNMGYALWGLGKLEDAKRKFRRFYRKSLPGPEREAALAALQEVSGGEIGKDGMTAPVRSVAKGTVYTSLAATGLGLVFGGIALEQAFIENKQGVDRPEGLIIATGVAFSVGAISAASGAVVLFSQQGTKAPPIQIFATPTQAGISIRF